MQDCNGKVLAAGDWVKDISPTDQIDMGCFQVEEFVSRDGVACGCGATLFALSAIPNWAACGCHIIKITPDDEQFEDEVVDVWEVKA